MSTQVLDRPAPANTAGADDDTFHYVCHDPDTAYCGEDVSDCDWAAEDEDTQVCPLCALVAKAGLPCPAGGCWRAVPGG